MPGDIVNLNRVRKARAKEAARERAEQNRLKHGESRTARQSREALHALSERRLDQATIVKPAVIQTPKATPDASAAFYNEDTSENLTDTDSEPGSQS